MKKHRNFIIRIWRNILAMMIRSERCSEQTKQFISHNTMNFFLFVAVFLLSACNVTRKVTTSATTHETTQQTVTQQATAHATQKDSTYLNSNTETVVDETITNYATPTKGDTTKEPVISSITHRRITQKQAVQAGKEVKSAVQADVNTKSRVDEDNITQTQTTQKEKANTSLSTYIVIAGVSLLILILLYLFSPPVHLFFSKFF